MVALFNGVGGGAVALISWAEYRYYLDLGGNPALETLIPILFAAVIGSVSFWGSNVAFGKLQEIIPGKPIALPGRESAIGIARHAHAYSVRAWIPIPDKKRFPEVQFS